MMTVSNQIVFVIFNSRDLAKGLPLLFLVEKWIDIHTIRAKLAVMEYEYRRKNRRVYLRDILDVMKQFDCVYLENRSHYWLGETMNEIDNYSITINYFGDDDHYTKY